MLNASVSVIVPCYRSTESISRAVESVFAQSIRPLEVILVDDCSPDDTLQQLYLEQRKYPAGWVKVIAMPQNGGPGNARNAGWSEASGQYIAFLDSDDCWYERKIELQYNWLESHPEAVLLGQYFGSGMRNESFRETIGFAQVTARQLLFSNRFTTSSVMLRRDIGERFTRDKRYCEDYQLWCDICYGGGGCYNIDFPLVRTFKPVYGDSGLSGQLWRMEQGELGVHVSLLRRRKIGIMPFLLAVSWSLMKFARRVLNSSVRKCQ
ncbi:glycosyltransferase family 2 protein [Pseudomonas sp. B22(2017)]|uniref:glycosyltransferase family 2 protein n=1 Tax=Pseudomonas sp. B22(2017) TaxID=1981736 RepID=UPI000A1F4D63|nr:glycosyltransferase family 2 protein [Pseudomonas sp. B22(2017)]